jgi:CheY-like chemotaxis protein
LVVKSLKRSLRDHDVVGVGSAHEALELCARESFDVVLCDLIMPQMSGVEFYRELERVRPQMLAHVVFITGGAFTLAAREFLETVRPQVVIKPLNAAELREIVRSAKLRTPLPRFDQSLVNE